MADIVRPWEVPLAEYKKIESSLKPSDELIKLSIKVTERLANGKKYGHVVAFLYERWVKDVGEEAAATWWATYEVNRNVAKAKQEALAAMPKKRPSEPITREEWETYNKIVGGSTDDLFGV